MTTEMGKHSGSELLKNFTDPMAAVEKLGSMFAKSGMFGLKTHEQGAIFALTCLMEGKTPMEIMRTYHIVQGRPTMRADAMHAAFLLAGGRVRWDRSDDKVCTITLTHADYAPNGVEVTIDRDDLDRAGVTKGKDNWRQYPKRMLQCRALSTGIRQVMPQIVSGIYTPEEAADFADDNSQAAPLLPKNIIDVASRSNTSDLYDELSSQRERAIKAFGDAGISVSRLEHKHGARSAWGPSTLKTMRKNLTEINNGTTEAIVHYPQLDDGAKSIVASFAKYGVIQSDLESWLGATFDPPAYNVPMSAWSKEDVDKLKWAEREIIEAQDPMSKAREIFNLEPCAQG